MEVFSLMVLMIMLVMVVVFGVVVYAVIATVRQRAVPPSLPSAAPLSIQTVETIQQLRGSGRGIEAVKVLRAATGMDLAQARNRIAGWSDVLELEAAQRAMQQRSAPSQEQVRIEASAILSTSGWHTAEAFLREQRGFSPEAAKALLDSLT